MKEIYRSPDSARVGLLADQIESEGIRTLIRNDTLSGICYPQSEFQPVLCVLDEADAERAVEIIRTFFAKAGPEARTEVACPICEETSPGNFSHCWKCGAELDSK
jgi:hypothetical protein